MSQLTRNKTIIYVECPGRNALDYVKPLEAAGFEIASKLTKLAMASELQRIVVSDMMLLFLDPVMPPATWVRVGYAIATGVQIIAIGDISINHLGIYLQVSTWDDLARNQFLALGDLSFKKAPRVRRDADVRVERYRKIRKESKK